MEQTMTGIESGTVITPEVRPAWLAGRRRTLGASEAAAALGVCPYRTPVELWQEKTGKAAPREETEPMLWGSLLEPVILGEYERRTGKTVLGRQLFLRHPAYPFLTATLDGECEGRLVEVKTASAWSTGFGEEDSDELPDAYRVQVHAQMAVVGAEAADLVVLIGGRRLRIYPVERDDALVREVVRGCVGFWKSVETGTPPTHGRVTAATLAVLHPGCQGEVVLDERVAALVRDYEAAGLLEKASSDVREWLKTEILAALGGAEYGVLPDGRRLRRYRQEVAEQTRQVTTKEHVRNYFKVLKGG